MDDALVSGARKPRNTEELLQLQALRVVQRKLQALWLRKAVSSWVAVGKMLDLPVSGARARILGEDAKRIDADLVERIRRLTP
jgi:hypothetical protein